MMVINNIGSIRLTFGGDSGDETETFLIVVFSASNFFGRLAFGFLSDRLYVLELVLLTSLQPTRVAPFFLAEQCLWNNVTCSLAVFLVSQHHYELHYGSWNRHCLWRNVCNSPNTCQYILWDCTFRCQLWRFVQLVSTVLKHSLLVSYGIRVFWVWIHVRRNL